MSDFLILFPKSRCSSKKRFHPKSWDQNWEIVRTNLREVFFFFREHLDFREKTDRRD